MNASVHKWSQVTLYYTKRNFRALKPMRTGHHLALITIITRRKKSVAPLFHRRPPSFTATSLFSSLFIFFSSQCRLIKPCNIQKLRTTAWFIIRYDFVIDPSSVFVWDKCACWISMRANDKRSGVWREGGQTYFRRDLPNNGSEIAKSSEIHGDEKDRAPRAILREICFQDIYAIVAFDQRRCQICRVRTF